MLLEHLLLGGVMITSAFAGPLGGSKERHHPQPVVLHNADLVERANASTFLPAFTAEQQISDGPLRPEVHRRADRQPPANQQQPANAQTHYVNTGQNAIALMARGGGRIPSSNNVRNAGWYGVQRRNFMRALDLVQEMFGWSGVRGFPAYNQPVALDQNLWTSQRWTKGPPKNDRPGFEFVTSNSQRAIVAINGFTFAPPDVRSHAFDSWSRIAGQAYTSASAPRWIVFEGVQDQVENGILLNADRNGGPLIGQGEADCFPLGSYLHELIMGFEPSVAVAKFLAARHQTWGAQTVASITVFNKSPSPDRPVLTIAYAIRPLDATLHGYAVQNNAQAYMPSAFDYPHNMHIIKE